jgi:hypothetical protein
MASHDPRSNGIGDAFFMWLALAAPASFLSAERFSLLQAEPAGVA